jgi:hypothetical protein
MTMLHIALACGLKMICCDILARESAHAEDVGAGALLMDPRSKADEQ